MQNRKPKRKASAFVNKRKRLRLSIRRAEQVEGATNLKEFAQRQAEEKASEGVGNATMFEALKRAKLVE